MLLKGASGVIYASVNLVIIGTGNGLFSLHHQAITWTNADLLSIEHSRWNCSEFQIKIETSSVKEMHFKICFGQTSMCQPIWGFHAHYIDHTWHIETDTKLTPFCRPHFQIHFLEWNLLYLDSNSTKLITGIWRSVCQKQISRPWISNYIPQYCVACNYLSVP